MHSAEATVAIWFIVVFVLFVILACLVVAAVEGILAYSIRKYIKEFDRQVDKALEWKE